MFGLSGSETILTISSAVLTQYRIVTDCQTDGQTSLSTANIALMRSIARVVMRNTAI